jgi:hypothetical protein
MLRYRNSIVKALNKAENAFTMNATLSGLGASMVNRRAISKNSGAPGGCPVSSLYDAAINSPQSQKLAVGSAVSRYVPNATRKQNQPTMLFNRDAVIFFIMECVY